MMVLLFVVLGALGWTFAEYVMHRFDGHGRKGKSLFSREHLRHHAQKDYFSPTWLKIAGMLPVITVMSVVAVLVAGWTLGLAGVGGFAAAYTGYEILHYRLHVSKPIGAYGRWVRKHHFTHHFVSGKYNHGASTPIWDWVFGTYHKVEKLRVPVRYAMVWLVDPNTGEVRSEYANDYELKRVEWRDPEAEAAKIAA